MDVNEMYKVSMSFIGPVLMLSGWLSFTITMIVALVNMIIDAASGKGFRFGLK